MPAASLRGNPDPSANEETRERQGASNGRACHLGEVQPTQPGPHSTRRAEDDRIQVGAGRQRHNQCSSKSRQEDFRL